MKVMTILGTRPEGIKMAPLIQCLKREPGVRHVLVNTAQHREMLDHVLDLFGLVPDYDFNIMKSVQTPESVSAEILMRLGPVLDAEKPDVVLVHGDTTTAFVSSYASYLKKIPVGHVEAGLRSGDRYSPFPEEMNRKMIDQLATHHFAVTDANRQNLLAEGIAPEQIIVIGNTVIDALLNTASMPFTPNPVLDVKGKILLVTTHRRENLHKLQGVYEALNLLVQTYPELTVIFPVHKNPLVRSEVHKFLHSHERVLITEPLDYLEFTHLMKRSYLVLTDSGGIQEEAPALNVPVFVARENTERPEGERAGTIKLTGLTKERILFDIKQVLDYPEAYRKMAQAENPYGDGRASERIKNHLVSIYRGEDHRS
ncbi:UDP-N-acetylglucosamine 2-epimerase (non-hydrolyzing) [Bacillus mangrovi]|uniref:UDP-N-acetylglucosamine 2-epimerase (non-hydrolyzing) n=1 Tax=Metabacillus mangrovi TaxID=1491830 RepID=A0A7X2V3F7_9BACI|nr:UDP-N-acetylglucosamine 2-epimerase (non-hydrolyzing) [Metabacillus mangrovi]MTH52034.1 UDP-N-acetylglucosamine 2-epimerase (non-hydrolyzing) [Metabacillus mangrovi]